MKRSFAIAAVLIGCCWGCGSGADDSSPTSPAIVAADTTNGANATTSSSLNSTTTTTAPAQTSPPTTPAPTTTENPFAAAGEIYLAARAANETGTTDLVAAYSDNTGTMTWEQTPPFCADMLALDTTYHDFVVGFDWPAEVTAESDQLEVALSIRMAVFADCASRAGTLAALGDSLDAWGGATQAVTRAQKKLHWAMGLPVSTA